MVALVSLNAFESLAAVAAMPTVARQWSGLPLYALAFGGTLATSAVDMTAAGRWSDRAGPGGAVAAGLLCVVVGLLVAGLAPGMPGRPGPARTCPQPCATFIHRWGCGKDGMPCMHTRPCAQLAPVSSAMDSASAAAWSGSHNAASSCQVCADGALTTAVDAWYMPIPGTGRACLAAARCVV
ncbi:hypothetical protein ADT25_13905 [Xanthomonas oryzae]|uniref:MFS transporter n=1 Tax=Xanthomonas oryzae TaxID=347 RepID=A0AAP0ZJU9_9XANT|nr:hypothetical protein ADT25_13905 [Xanthomonas oryzae]